MTWLQRFLLISGLVGLTSSKLDQGVAFSKIGEYTFTGDSWTVVLEVRFQEYYSMLEGMNENLADARLGLRVLKDSKEKMQNHLYHLINGEIDQICNETILLRGRLDTLERLFTIKRSRRGIVGGVGDVLKFLFGTAKDADLEGLSSRMDKMDVRPDKIVHLIEEQATVLGHVVEGVAELKKAIRTTREFLDELQEQAMGLNKFLSFQTQVFIIRKTMDSIIEEIDGLENAMELLMQQKISPYLLQPGSMLESLRQQLSRDFRLLVEPREEMMYKYYEGITVVPMASIGCLRIGFKIPLQSLPGSFDVFKILTIPVLDKETGYSVSYVKMHPFIAVSKDTQSYILMDGYTISQCKAGSFRTCYPMEAILRHPYQSCEYALFMADEKAVLRLCQKQVLVDHHPVFHRVSSEGLWVYSLMEKQIVVISCSHGPSRGSTMTTINLNEGTGTLSLNPGCYLSGTGFHLNSFYHGHSDEIFQDNLTIPQISDIISHPERELLLNLKSQENTSLVQKLLKAIPKGTGREDGIMLSKVKKELEEIKIDTGSVLTVPHTTILVTVALILILVIVVVFVCRRIRTCHKKKKIPMLGIPNDRPEEVVPLRNLC